MEFHFKCTPYNSSFLNNQLSAALKMRIMLISREKYPKLWAFTDKMNSRKASEKARRRRRVLYKLFGVFLLAAGIFLLVPGLMEPKELFIPLVTGVFFIVIGICCLCYSRRRKKLSSFDKASQKLLDGLREMPSIKVSFTDAGMSIADGELISFDRFERVIDTQDLIVLIWDKRITVLQKKDLVEENIESFFSFISMYVSKLDKAI